MSSQDDETLSARLKSEPERALRLIYDRYSGPLMRFVYRFTEDHASAEDILHDVFAELLGGKFAADQNSDASLKNWLFTVARNKCLNVRRRLDREIKDGALVEKAVDSRDWEAASEQRSLLNKIKSSEHKLPSDLKDTWDLRKQGHDYQQIASRLSIPLGTVKSRFSRLVAFFREELE